MNSSILNNDGRRMNATQALLEPQLNAGRENEPAIGFKDQIISYGDLDKLVNQFGNALKAAHVEPENRVLFMLKDSPNLVAAYLGTMKIGAVSIAYNVRTSEKDLLYVLIDSRAKVIFIDTEFLETFRNIASQLQNPIKVIVEDSTSREFTTISTFLEGHSAVLQAENTSADDMAFWLYTSGTTGKPKACVHLQHDVLEAKLHLIENLGVKPGDRVFATSKLFFTYAIGHIMMGGLAAGAQIILYDGWPDAIAVSKIINTYKPHLVFSVPTLYRNLLCEGMAKQGTFKNVRHYISAGEKLPSSLFRQWEKTTGVRILEGIGCSETFHLFIANTPEKVREGSCGTVASWAQFKLVDDTGQQVIEPNKPGVGWVYMESNCDRYWNRQAKSTEVLSKGWYCTDDIFSFDVDKFYYHHGRKDDMLKISGQWVSPSEIEDIVHRVYGVEEAAVVGKADQDGLIRLSLYIVKKNNLNKQANEKLTERVQTAIKEKLSIYKCPRNIEYIDEIPRTSSGKIQRYLLR